MVYLIIMTGEIERMTTRQIIYILIIFILIACVVASISTYLFNTPCRNLKQISGNQNMTNRIWNNISFFYKDPTKLRALGLKRGLFYLDELKGDLGSEAEWEEIGIAPNMVTLEIAGEEIDYSYIDYNKIEEVKVGFGSRYKLIYILPSNKYLVGRSDEQKMAWSEVRVVCDTTNR